jgi:hypothetical protein
MHTLLFSGVRFRFPETNRRRIGEHARAAVHFSADPRSLRPASPSREVIVRGRMMLLGASFRVGDFASGRRSR